MSPNPPPLDAEPEPKPDSGEAQPSVAMEATPSAVSLEMPSMSGTLVALPAARPLADEDTIIGDVEASQTKTQRGMGLGFFVLVALFFAVLTARTLSWNWSYVERFSALPSGLAAWNLPAFPYPAPLAAIVGTIQILALGTMARRVVIPGRREPWETIAFVIGLGEGLTGLTATILAIVGRFTFVWLELALLGEIGMFAVLCFIREGVAGFRLPSFRQYVPHLRVIEWVAVGGIAFVFGLILYQASFYPIAETDALIYHAPLAALVYYHEGLPWIVGGGVGLGSSANYPQLFSLLGSYFYVWTGGVNDVYLRLVGAMNWGVVIYASFLIGRRLAGRRHGFLAAVLAASVPSFVSYASFATQETTVVMFGAVGFLAFLKATQISPHRRYGLLAGLMLGFAALSSYQGLYFLLPLLLLFGIALMRHWGLRLRAFLHAEPMLYLLMIGVGAATGSAPYIRNWILLHDPVYPFFRSWFPSPYLGPITMGFAELEWRSVARVLVGFDSGQAGFWDFLVQFATHPSFAPLNLAFTIPALFVLPVTRVRRARELAAFYSATLLGILAGPVPFIRYVWLLVPFAAIIVAGGALAALQALRTWKLPGRLRRGERLAVEAAGRVPVALLVGLFLLPVVVGFGGNAYFFGTNADNRPYFRYFSEPGVDLWTYMRDTYGNDALAWQWFDDHLGPGQRIASLENRVYYLSASLRDPHMLLYLDGQEAEPLYTIQDPAAMADYLTAHGVSYVFVRGFDWKSYTTTALPLFRWLGSPYFPWEIGFGGTFIFRVGIQAYPDVPRGNPVGLYGMPGLNSSVQFQGKPVLQIVKDSTTPRVSVLSTTAPQLLVVRYWDSGVGELTLNLRRIASNSWYTIDRSAKANTSTWRTAAFVVPTVPGQGFIEFGLHAFSSDFIVDDIEVKPILESWIANAGSQPIPGFTNATTPPAIFLYLPFLVAGQHLTILAGAVGSSISVEVYRGLISPSHRTSWWVDYRAAARSPALPQLGLPNPKLDRVIDTSGTYTLVVVLWSAWQPGLQPDVNVTIA